MRNIRVFPGSLRGELAAPPSKSAAHRALICAALAEGESRVAPLADSADMAATIGALRAMGAQIERSGDAATICGGKFVKTPATLDCLESGSTLRFLLPVAAALGLPATFTGAGRLPERPIGLLTEQLTAHGVRFSRERMPFALSGRMEPGVFTLPGDVSSQFVSGLLFALPLLAGESEIRLTGPLQSAGYVQMTLAALAGYGVTIEETPSGYRVPGNQHYRACTRAVEADWSNAAFWLAAGAIGGAVRLRGLQNDSVQGDRAIYALLDAFGATMSMDAQSVAAQAAPLQGCRIDAGPIPDLVPILAAVAACADGMTEIYNAARLRIKESDRLATVTAMLRSLGGRVEEYPDRLIIHGGRTLTGGVVDGANDHRIVMSAAILALRCQAPVEITDVDAVHKSYPNFFEDYQTMGGRCDVIQLGEAL